MSNRLIKLESGLRASEKRRPAPPSRPTTPSPSIAAPRVYQLPEQIDPVASEKANGAWASVYTMMNAWRRAEPLSIEATLSELDGRWLTAYQQDLGLTRQQGVEFLAAAGLSAKPPQALTADVVHDALTEFGPLWLTVDSTNSAAWSPRAWLITGITGGATPDRATIHAIDATNGEPLHRKLSSFSSITPAQGTAGFVVVHWPANVRAERAVRSDVPTDAVPMNLKSVVASPIAGATPSTDLDSVVRGLVQQGANEADLRTFLADAGAQVATDAPVQAAALTVPAAAQQPAVTLPNATILDDFRAQAFRAALQTALGAIPGAGAPVAIILAALPALATRHNVTIGIGPAVSGGFVAGIGLGAGIVFAPGNRIGYYGSISGILGAIVSISATAQVTVVKGGPEKFGGESILAGITIDTAVGPTIGAHAILSPQGGFIGVTGELGVSLGLSPIEAFVQYQHTATSLGISHQASAAPREFDIKFRIFIPAPAVDGPGTNPFGGDGRGFDYSAGSHRCVIHARVTAGMLAGHPPSMVLVDRGWGQSTEYNQSDVRAVPGKPFWYKALVGSPTPIRRSTLPTSPSNLGVSVRNVTLSGGRHAAKIRLQAAGAIPLLPAAPDIDAKLDIYLTYAGGWKYMLRGDHDGFPAYELYIDRHRVYGHDPLGSQQTPASLLPPAEFSVHTPWRSI